MPEKPKPRGFLLALLRLPRWLYRAGLGWLLGHRFLLLTHRGRRSGKPYETVLEVARYSRIGKTCVVLAGWGARSDWYLNVQAGGALQVQVGTDRFVPCCRFLSPTEAYFELQDYLRRNPWARPVARRLFGLRLDGSDPHWELERLAGAILWEGGERPSR